MKSEGYSSALANPRTPLGHTGVSSAQLFGVLIVSLVFAGCDSSQPTSEEMLERGFTHLENGDSERSIAAFTESLRLRPDDADAHYNRGLAHVRLGNFEAARKDYTHAIRIRPEFAEAYANRAVTYARRGRLDEAIADCSEAIRLNPNDALAFRNRGLAHHDQGRFERALADFDEALRLDNGLAEAYFNRAHSYLQVGKTDKAAADFAEAGRLDPALDIPDEFAAPLPVDQQASSSAELSEPGIEPASFELEVAPSTAIDFGLEAVADIYRGEGFAVEAAAEIETGSLICRKDALEVRVVIKTVSDASEAVRLTAVEIEQARDPSTRTDLIVLQTGGRSEPEPEAQVIKRLIDWAAPTDNLKPVEFELVP